MSKIILITGSTDGIGLETMKMLLPLGHTLIVHGRTETKVNNTVELLSKLNTGATIHGVTADLVDRAQIRDMVEVVKTRFGKIDVLINNAGVYNVNPVKTNDNLDVRFSVNTIAPYYLTKLLLPIIAKDGRVVNLSSAAQSPVDLNALKTFTGLGAGDAYAQSKLALTMWSMSLALENPDKVIVAVNPKSFLGSKMVKDAYGMEGHDLRIGADILTRASLSDEFKDANGLYFDNDRGIFTDPYPTALSNTKRQNLIKALEDILR